MVIKTMTDIFWEISGVSDIELSNFHALSHFSQPPSSEQWLTSRFRSQTGSGLNPGPLLSVVWPWANYLTSVCVSFCMCKRKGIYIHLTVFLWRLKSKCKTDSVFALKMLAFIIINIIIIVILLLQWSNFVKPDDLVQVTQEVGVIAQNWTLCLSVQQNSTT